ncbi:MAG: hypothetical protein EP317_04565 [Bacillota bacterium]|nr:MAG: hypothetical protein EP317_04565 [Bacillota bacterium]
MKDMIERYVYAVTRRLPENIQAEVKNELRANIYDMLSENPSEEEIEKVLKELGHPRDMAAKYQPKERYLISPKYFGDYIYTLKIVIMIFILVSFAIGLIEAIIGYQSANAFDLIGKIFSVGFESIFDGLYSGFAIVTIVFIIIEQVQKQKKMEWNVKDLPELPKEGKIKISRTGTILAIIFSVSFSLIFIMILVEYHKYIGLYVEGEMITPFFNPDAIKVFIPFFIGILGLNIVILLLKLVDGRWTKRVTILYTIHEIVNLVLLIVFFNISNLIDPNFFNEFSNIIEVSVDEVANGFRVGFRSLVAFISVLVMIDLVSLWYRVIKFDKKKA